MGKDQADYIRLIRQVRQVRQVRHVWNVDNIGERLLATARHPAYAKWWHDLEQIAQRALTEPLPVLHFASFRQFRDDGQRIPYEKIYFERRGRLVALALMRLRLQAEGQEQPQNLSVAAQNVASDEQYAHTGMDEHTEVKPKSGMLICDVPDDVEAPNIEQAGGDEATATAGQAEIGLMSTDVHFIAAGMADSKLSASAPFVPIETIDHEAVAAAAMSVDMPFGSLAASIASYRNFSLAVDASDRIAQFDVCIVQTALEDVLWDVCGEYTWCLPAHLPERADTPAWQQIDLFTAETAGMLAELAVLLDGLVDQRIVERIQLEIGRRVLDVLSDPERQFDWETAEHNWAAVCASGCGIAALLAERDTERQQFILNRLLKALAYFLASYGEDGGCAEGIGYWVYGFGYFTYWLEMLEAIGYPVQLSESQQRKIRAIASFPQDAHLSGGVFVNFSDSEERQALPTGLLSRLAQRYGWTVSLPFTIPLFSDDHCQRWAHMWRDLLWSEPAYFESSDDAVACCGVRTAEREQGRIEGELQGWIEGGLDESVAVEVNGEIGKDVDAGVDAETDASIEASVNIDGTVPSTIQVKRADDTDKRMERTSYAASRHIKLDTPNYYHRGSRYWRDLEWLIVPGVIGWAAKGGHNDEPHNHNDVGSFIIHGGRQNLLCDPGAGMYTAAYFAAGREAILHISSAGHSVPSINGLEQQSGRQYAATVLQLEQRAQETVMMLELAGAYPKEAQLNSFTRRFHWQCFEHTEVGREQAQLEVHDCFLLYRPGAGDEDNGNDIDINERLISRIEPQIGKDFVLWQGESALVRLDLEHGRYQVDVEQIASHDHEGRAIVFYRTSFRLHISVEQSSREWKAVSNQVTDVEHRRERLGQQLDMPCLQQMDEDAVQPIEYVQHAVRIQCRFTFTVSSQCERIE